MNSCLSRLLLATLLSGLILALLNLLDAGAAAPPRPVSDLDGKPLSPSPVARLGSTQLRQDGTVESVAWSLDGKYIVSGHSSRTIRVWDAETGRLLATPLRDRGGPLARFTEDSKVIVASGHDSEWGREGGYIYLLDWTSGKSFSAYAGGQAREMGLSTKSHLVAAPGSSNRDIVVFDYKSQAVKHTLEEENPFGIGAIALSKDGALLASTYNNVVLDPTIRLWSMKDGEKLGKLTGHEKPVRAMVFLPGDKLLLSVSLDETARVWDVATRKELRRFAVPKFTTGLALSKDGKKLATCRGSSPIVQIHDPETGKILHTLPDCGGGINAIAFSPDGKKLVTGGTYRVLRIWDVETGKEVLPQSGHLDAVFSLQFSPDGKSLASRGADHCVRVWDLATRRERHRLSLRKAEGYGELSKTPPLPTTSLAYSPDGKWLAARSDVMGIAYSHVIHLWDTSDYRTSRELPEERVPPLSLAFSPDSKTLASGNRLWDVAKGSWYSFLIDPNPEERNGRPRHDTYAVAVAPDNRTLAIAARTKAILWDWTSGKHLGALPVPPGKYRGNAGSAYLVAFSPGGHLLAAGAGYGSGNYPDRDRVIHLFEPATESAAFTLTTQFARDVVIPSETGGRPKVIPAPPAEIHAIAFSPDGRLLALACGDGRVRVWDVFARKQLADWKGHEGEVLTVAFSPDGRTLASGGMDTTILLWDVRDLKLTPPAAGESTLAQLDAALKDKDASKAHRAIWELAGHADAAKHLSKSLTPVAKLDAARVKRLLEQFEDEDSTRRDAASAELEKLGLALEPILRRTLASQPKPETRRRVTRLLGRLDALRGTSIDLFESRAVLALELAGTDAARALLRSLAGGEADAPLTRAAKQALTRIDLVRGRAKK